MSLLQYPAPVDYAAQKETFKDFLQHFKTFESASETAAAEAIEDLHIDGDGTSDEYDFMSDVEDENGASRSRRRREPKLKYMQILQEVADRERSSILIELDDLEAVSHFKICSALLVTISNYGGLWCICSSRNPFLRSQT